jgi:hypothetical protein
MGSIDEGDRIESAIVFEPEPPPSDPEPEPELDPEPEPEPPPSDLSDIPLQFWRLPPGDRIAAMRRMPHVGKQLEQNPGQFKGVFRLVPSGGLSLAGYYK